MKLISRIEKINYFFTQWMLDFVAVAVTCCDGTLDLEMGGGTLSRTSDAVHL